MVLTREQQQVLSALLTAGGKIQDPRARRAFDKSAVETGLVETNLTNPSGGDADSAGWRQERASLYPDPTNLTASADRYRQEFLKAYKPGAKSYDLSAAIQRPRADLRGRYKDVAGEAAQILKTVGGSRGASLPADAGAPSGTPGTPGSVDPGQSGDAAALLAALAAQQKPQIASGGLAPPAATARPVLPSGFQQTASSSSGPAPAPDISSLLALAATPGLSGQATPGTPASGSDAGASLAPSGGSGGGISRHARPGDPVVSGKQSVGGVHETMGLAGFPAHDYFAPAGSHAVAPVSGTVVKLSGHDPKAGPTNGPHGPLGWSTYIKGSDGKTYFLTHMGSRNVQVGQTVKQGQIIGTVANYDRYGTPSHIHMGVSG